MRWWPRRKNDKAHRRFFKTESDLLRALVQGQNSANRAFILGLLQNLLANNALSKEQAALILRQTADMARLNKGTGPLSDMIADPWDEMAIIFEPREPGPLPPEHLRIPRIDD